ncbi:MAG: hypothetical protein Q8S13_11615 [Dehalococcoidia bacterium]|nr:hypothetical protein [Dehalococcoidia bacterium]
MRLFTSTLITVSAVALTVPTAHAQQAAADSARTRAVQTLKNDLRNYVTMQERYYQVHSTYAGVASQTLLQPSAGVTFIVLSSSNTGHNAVAIHRDAPDLVCGIWVGRDPRPPLYDGAAEGVPTCRLP